VTSITLITPPSAPVSVAEAKRHLRIDHADEDSVVEGLIASAVSYLDGWTGVLGRALEAQTWELALDRFPVGQIVLPLGPVASVTSVAYTDPAGVEQTVDSANYVVDTRPIEGRVIPADGFAWPSTKAGANAVRVRWVAGTGTPGAIRVALLMLVAHWYRVREAVGEDMKAVPLGVEALIVPFRRVGL
jgi:uncharacterized phiE125 gp8 family phage protein